MSENSIEPRVLGSYESNTAGMTLANAGRQVLGSGAGATIVQMVNNTPAVYQACQLVRSDYTDGSNRSGFASDKCDNESVPSMLLVKNYVEGRRSGSAAGYAAGETGEIALAADKRVYEIDVSADTAQTVITFTNCPLGAFEFFLFARPSEYGLSFPANVVWLDGTSDISIWDADKKYIYWLFSPDGGESFIGRRIGTATIPNHIENLE